ncbi:MAG: NAD+ synthase [Balneolaceae bacterium]|nr:NAD+ synthase [Balneolaceae bacterium]
MKVRVQQLNPTIGDISGNTTLIIEALENAGNDGLDLLVLPELCVCGYSPMDLLERPAFLDAVERANQKIIAETNETALIFGSVVKNDDRRGRPCFNVAIMAHKGQVVATVRKTLLPTYDVFDEGRYFEPSDTFECIDWNGAKLGITICEDIWANNSVIQYHTYPVEPVQELAHKGADAIFNISASPFTIEKSEDRQRMLQKTAKEYGLPVFYVNQTGANAELVSDGDSLVLDADANIIARAPLFEPAHIDVKWNPGQTLSAIKGTTVAEVPSNMERVFLALTCGLQQYLAKTGVASEVILGLSGGIDSALVACVAAEALGPENVTAVLMPSEFSSEGSITDAETLAQNLGIPYNQLPIEEIYEQYIDALKPLFKDEPFGIAEENIQSRARGVLLMAISNKFGGLVLNTGNKSELATGYCTLYGDMNGALAVISDLYKTEVFELAEWLNNLYYEKEIIPQTILDKPPSAELRPDQKDSDSLPDYDILDTILKFYIEKQLSVGQIEDKGFDRKMIERIIQLVDQNEYKRFQAAPGLKVHTKSFGTGRRWPLVQKWTQYRLD